MGGDKGGLWRDGGSGSGISASGNCSPNGLLPNPRESVVLCGSGSVMQINTEGFSLLHYSFYNLNLSCQILALQ